MPRTMTVEREAEIRGVGALPTIKWLLAELDAERAESQRLQLRVEALEGALRQIWPYLGARGQTIVHAALYPEPATPISQEPSKS